jgi:hypothetical protein
MASAAVQSNKNTFSMMLVEIFSFTRNSLTNIISREFIGYNWNVLVGNLKVISGGNICLFYFYGP